MQADLVAWLRSEASLSATLATVNSRAAIDWITRPEEGAVPSITLQTISMNRQYREEGRDSLTESRVQCDIWAVTYLDARTAFDALEAVLEGAKTQGATEFVRGFLEEPRDLPQDDLADGTKVYRISADFILWHR